MDVLASLIRRLWNAEHVMGYDYEIATLDEFTSSKYFGTDRANKALSVEEIAALRKVLTNA